MGSKNIRLSPEQEDTYRGRLPDLLAELGYPRDARITVLEYTVRQGINMMSPRYGPKEGPLLRITHEDIKDG